MRQGLQERLRAAVALVPRCWGGRPASRWRWRATRVLQPAQRLALAVRDGAVWSRR